MNLLKRWFLVVCAISVCFTSFAVASTTVDNRLSLKDGLNSSVLEKALKTSNSPSVIVASISPIVDSTAILARHLEYTPSLERRQTNLNQLAEQRQVKHLKGADELEALLSSTQVIDAVEQTIQPYGLVINNIADAYTLWWITAWQASEGESVVIDKEIAQAVKQQAMMIWLANPQLAEASDENKQEIAEALLIQALLTQAAMSRAGDDKSAKQAVKDAVRQGAASSGLALEQMQLTEQGFVLKP